MDSVIPADLWEKLKARKKLDEYLDLVRYLTKATENKLKSMKVT